jgi:hypothetical protein
MITPDDEYLHADPGTEPGLWSDNFWLSVCDRDADVFGVLHVHATNRGYARFSTMLVIDGLPMPWANKTALTVQGRFDRLTDGRMAYTVVRPMEAIRVMYDGPRYGFDLRYTGRFPVFDYRDCLGGNPLSSAMFYGGHYEQGLACRGEIEVRGGPRPGRRTIDCFAHRDHSWTYRFSRETPWDVPPLGAPQSLGHYWPSVQLPTRHLNAFGWMNPAFVPPHPGAPAIGGFVSDANGSRPIRDASCEVRLEDDGRTAMSFRHRFTLQDGEVLHVRSARKYAQIVNGQMRGENDAECTMDCYEAFFDWEVEETGERGTGCAEYSIMPPSPRWRY